MTRARRSVVPSNQPDWDGLDWDLVGSTYQIWRGMRARCRTRPGYAGRGITVCQKWQTFSGFIEDMGVRPSYEHSIDRKDVNGNYEKDNCFWATPTEQVRNRRNTVFVDFEDRHLTLAELCVERGLSLTMVYRRVCVFNWPLTLALEAEARSIKHMPKYGRRHDRRSIIEVGARFSSLTVLGEAERARDGTTMCICECDCGVKIVTKWGDVRNGQPRSCGRCDKGKCGNPPRLYLEAAA